MPRRETADSQTGQLIPGGDYCGSKWAHKAHDWYDAAGQRCLCPGATTAEKPNKERA